jgi:UDP-glucose 4-epimerase
MVRRESGIDFKAAVAPRRPGDMARIVCTSDRIRDVLGWRPRHDDLAGIVRTAYAWECYLRDNPGLRAASRGSS